MMTRYQLKEAFNRNLHRSMFLLILLCSCNKSDDEPIPEPISTESKLQAIIDEKVRDDKLVGVSVSIRIDGEEKWKLVGGLSRLNEPITDNMLFGIASITKTMVAAAILKLEEEGKLDLDDTIGDWLDLNSPNVAEGITIRQLLKHFSGLRNYFAGENLWPTLEGDLNNPISPVDLVNFIGEPIFEPGERYEYSNSNYLILGLIIEAVSGQSVGLNFRNSLWAPFQINNIYFGDDEILPAPIAAAWRDRNGDGTLSDISGEYGPAYHSVFWTAADVFSTASDLSLWAHHLYEGDVLTPLNKFKMKSFTVIDDPIFTGYGLGIRRFQIAGRTLIGHTGGMRGYGSYMVYDPLKKITIVVLNNQSRSEDGPILRHQLVQELLLELLKL